MLCTYESLSNDVLDISNAKSMTKNNKRFESCQDQYPEIKKIKFTPNNRLWAPLIKGGHKPPTVYCHFVY